MNTVTEFVLGGRCPKTAVSLLWKAKAVQHIGGNGCIASGASRVIRSHSGVRVGWRPAASVTRLQLRP